MENIDYRLIRNAGFPEGENGERMLEHMNSQHKSLTQWGFSHIKCGKRILDAGCGGGEALAFLLENYPDSILSGCDISPLALRKAEERNAAAVERSRISFCLSDVSNLDYSDSSFDTVFSVESLYFWKNPSAGLGEIFRVLSPGGNFMTVLEMVGGAMSERHREIAKTLKMFCPSPAELEKLLKDSGFTSVSVEFEPSRKWLCGTGRKAFNNIKKNSFS